MNKKVRPIIIHDHVDDVDYTLEFTRATVKFAESRGFSIDDVAKYPMTKLYELFFYSFRANHKDVARAKTDKIIDEYWGGIGGIPDGVVERLGELYAEPFNATIEDVDVKNKKATVEL